MSRRGKVIALLAVLIAGGVLASEVALRVLTSRSSRWNVRIGAAKQFDPVTFFRNKPFYDYGGGVVGNEYGYLAPRGLAREKPDAEVRIIYLGDSASHQPLPRNYPIQVEELLEAEGIPVQTVNTAVPGFSSENARALFETEVSQFDADYLFVYLGWNDLGQFGPEGLPYKKHQAGYEVSAAQQLLSAFYTPRMIFALLRHMQRRRPTVNEPLTREEAALYGGYYPQHFEDNLRRILALAREKYDHVHVMNLATITSADPTEDEMARAHFPTGMSKNVQKLHTLVLTYNGVIERVARSEGIPMIDLFAAFDSREARRGFTDSAHMSEEGAHRMAEILAGVLRESARIRSEERVDQGRRGLSSDHDEGRKPEQYRQGHEPVRLLLAGKPGEFAEKLHAVAQSAHAALP